MDFFAIYDNRIQPNVLKTVTNSAIPFWLRREEEAIKIVLEEIIKERLIIATTSTVYIDLSFVLYTFSWNIKPIDWNPKDGSVGELVKLWLELESEENIDMLFDVLEQMFYRIAEDIYFGFEEGGTERRQVIELVQSGSGVQEVFGFWFYENFLKKTKKLDEDTYIKLFEDAINLLAQAVYEVYYIACAEYFKEA